MTQDEYWSGMTYLKEQGKIAKTGARGIYRIIKEESDNGQENIDTGHV